MCLSFDMQQTGWCRTMQTYEAPQVTGARDGHGIAQQNKALLRSEHGLRSCVLEGATSILYMAFDHGRKDACKDALQ
jgi:hypothetical protein